MSMRMRMMNSKLDALAANEKNDQHIASYTKEFKHIVYILYIGEYMKHSLDASRYSLVAGITVFG